MQLIPNALTFKPACAALALAGMALLGAGSAHAVPVVVTGFATSYPGNGQWYESDVRPGGSASVVGLSGVGGNLEAGHANGAALLTTDGTNAAKAEVYITNSFGTASSILPTISLSYDYYRSNAPGTNTAAAPALKLSFYNPIVGPGNGDVTLIYEPYWNLPGDPTPGQWNHVTIDFNNGLFWQNGGFGQANSAGGPPLKTLADWLTTFDLSFGAAQLVGVGMGVGTYNPGQTDYFDMLHVAAGRIDAIYDFQAAASDVPEPATLALAALGLVGLGASRARRRSKG